MNVQDLITLESLNRALIARECAARLARMIAADERRRLRESRMAGYSIRPRQSGNGLRVPC